MLLHSIFIASPHFLPGLNPTTTENTEKRRYNPTPIHSSLINNHLGFNSFTLFSSYFRRDCGESVEWIWWVWGISWVFLLSLSRLQDSRLERGKGKGKGKGKWRTDFWLPVVHELVDIPHPILKPRTFSIRSLTSFHPNQHFSNSHKRTNDIFIKIKC